MYVRSQRQEHACTTGAWVLKDVAPSKCLLQITTNTNTDNRFYDHVNEIVDVRYQ